MNAKTDHQRAIGEGFRRSVKGILSDEKIEEVLADLHAAETTYSAAGGLGGFLFYMHIGMDVYVGGRNHMMDADAGGFFGFGASRLDGQLRSSDFPRLFAATRSIHFEIAIPYASILFFDAGSNFLGHFQGVAAGTQVGIGGGSASWK
jgi:hypothetical protein